MNRLFYLLLFIACYITSCTSYKVTVSKISDNGSSRATAYIDSNKLISLNDTIYFLTYLENNDKKFQIVVSKITPTDTIKSFVVNDVRNNHGGASVILDKYGYLHLFYTGHHSSLFHLKGKNKLRTDDWIVIDSFPGRYTYPSVAYNSADNMLHILVREIGVKEPWSISYFNKTIDGSFSIPKKLVYTNFEKWKRLNKTFHYTQSGYSRWNKTIVANKEGDVFIAFRNYEYPPLELNYPHFDNVGGASYFVSYLYSSDNGNTWSSGKSIKEKFYPKDLDIISGDSLPAIDGYFHFISNSIINDNEGYFVYTTTDSSNESKIFWTKVPFNSEPETQLIPDFNPSYEVIGPIALSMDKKGNRYIMANAIKKSEYCNCTDDWGRPSNSLVMLVINKKLKLKHAELIDTQFLDPSGNTVGPVWLPATEYFKPIDGKPAFLITAGQKGSNNTQMVDNKIFLLKVLN